MTTYPQPPTGRIQETPDGRLLTIERTFRAPIEDVWASFTEPDRLARWYGDVTGKLRAGETVTVAMTAEEGAPVEPVRIIECVAPHRLVIETAGTVDPWRLQIQLAEAAGVTTMTFTHALADDLDATDIGPGWEYYADRHHAAFHDTPPPDWTADRYQEILGPHYNVS
jgi:uncharacterized protein YndB with AHSA1/START domain